MEFSRMAASLLAQGDEGGGTALNEIIGLSAAGAVVTAVLLWIGYLHRNHKITWLTSLADWSGRRFKRPPWVALPIAMFVSSIICALFGFIWDVSLHIGNGRDDGALANPAHYFILIGLFGIFVAGCTAMVLPVGEEAKPGPSAVRITDDWHAPVGGIVMAGCGLYALMGFPLDDVWHRIFGQDVTLWGPTHLMMIGGAGVSTLAALYLAREGRRGRPGRGGCARPDGARGGGGRSGGHRAPGYAWPRRPPSAGSRGRAPRAVGCRVEAAPRRWRRGPARA